MPRAGPHVEAPSAARSGLPQMITRAAEPLPEIGEAEFARLFDRFGDARVVLLGASTLGTSEFHRARAAITRWLVEQRGFTIVALDADWADAAVLDAHVRGATPQGQAGPPFAGFPAWTWRNREFAAFIAWLRAHNARRAHGPKTGVHGLDLYGLVGAMRTVIDHLDRLDPAAAETARHRFGCMTPWADEPTAYERLALTSAYARHERPIVALLSDRLAGQLRGEAGAILDSARRERLIREAADHYRAIYYGAIQSWNRRAAHMFATLDALMASRGTDAKAVVWAHNASVGDARATDMGVIREEVNLGQLCRETWGREAALIGLGTHGGALACASDWDAPMEVKTINPALADSIEGLSHAAGQARYLLDLRPQRHDDLRAQLAEPRLQRFIGAVYRPDTERGSHYAEGRLSRQYDAWVWFDETTAVTPLPATPEAQAWPSG